MGGAIFGTLFLHVFCHPAGPAVELETVLVQRCILRANIHVLGDDCFLSIEFLLPSPTHITGILYNSRDRSVTLVSSLMADPLFLFSVTSFL